ncbi:hypothetical protein PAAG_11562 [Paracoccidioides lutzii Pb01]|uniref:Uncharacterized protein n=1 Tax=Paracoccidioides lutzii (strain ATCC MYA-826 / Pb01) TaxID=502779 RepID=A0A0A2V6K0_PARBA|nr:hypothetical protein PAAG_11562 [Paracoccidioides lutzii Pb01]KGQ01715.1 hypothetical protein PAAG_11562 [Paracoccidioides lutzii Pb01]
MYYTIYVQCLFLNVRHRVRNRYWASESDTAARILRWIPPPTLCIWLMTPKSNYPVALWIINLSGKEISPFDAQTIMPRTLESPDGAIENPRIDHVTKERRTLPVSLMEFSVDRP